MEIGLVLFFSLLFGYFSYKRLDWACLFAVAALPVYQIRFSVFGIPSTLLEVMILSVSAVWLFRFSELKQYVVEKRGVGAYIRDRVSRMPYPFGEELIILILIAFLSAGVAGFSNEAMGIYKAYFFEPILFYIVLANVFKGGKESRLIAALAVSALAVSAVAIFQRLSGGVSAPFEYWSGLTYRTTSIYSYPNAVGLYLAPMVFLFAGVVIGKLITLARPLNNQDTRNNNQKITNSEISNNQKNASLNTLIFLFFSVIVLLSVLSIFFAKSKGALLGLAAGAVVFGLLVGRRARIMTIAIVIVLAAGIATYQPARELAIERLRLQDFSGEIRKQQWRETWQMLNSSPAYYIFGAGLSGYQAAVAPFHQEGIFFNKDKDPDFRRKIVIFDERYKIKYWQPTEIYMYPHNVFLNFWTELGVAGMLLFIWIFLKYFKKGIALIGNWELGIGKNEKSELVINDQGIGERGVRNGEQEICSTGLQSGAISDFSPNKKGKCYIVGLISSMVVIFVHGLVDVPYFKNDLAVLFMIVLLLLGLAEIRHKKESDEKA